MTIVHRIRLALALICTLAACGGGGGSSSSDPLEERPYQVKVPAGYNPATPTPLVVVLHGLGGNGAQILAYFRLDAAADRHGFLVAYPNGTRDPAQRNHWNGTDACCATGTSPEDDVRYLSLMLGDIETKYNIDGARVYFIGHSNGAFMSHRMACDRSTRVAAIVALAGVSWKDPDDCPAQQPVNILQVHGDLDNAILYDGGFYLGAPYPSAVDTVSDWATLNGCTGALVDSGPNLDIDAALPGADTRVQRYTGCPAGGEIELWTILGGGHVPAFDDNWPDALWTFLSSHPKP